jgi:hypothetical protein
MKSATVGKSLILGAGLATTLCFAAAPEPVGKIVRTEGWAVVTQGAQYVRASEGMPLREGDRLIALKDSSVTIHFADGCELTLAENELLTVGPVSTCASDAVGHYRADPKSGVATVADAPPAPRPAALEPPTPPPPPPVAIVPAAAGGGWMIPAALLGGAILLADDDGDGPRPPISR